MKDLDVTIENLFCYRSEQNNLSFKDLASLTLLVGEREGDPTRSNGAGKSSILEAVAWTWFGKTVRDIALNEIVNDTIPKEKRIGRGTVKWIGVDRVEYKVTRMRDLTRTEPTTSLELHTDGIKFPSDKKDSVQNEIIRVLGFDYNTFRNTVMFGQNDGSIFLTSTSEKERRDVVAKIFPLELVDKTGKIIEVDRKLLQTQITAVKSRLDTLRDQFKTLTDAKLADQLKTYQDEKEAKEKEIVRLEGEKKKQEAEVEKQVVLEQVLIAEKQKLTGLSARISTLEEEIRERRGRQITTREFYEKKCLEIDAKIKEQQGKEEEVKKAEKIFEGLGKKESLIEDIAKIEQNLSTATSKYESSLQTLSTFSASHSVATQKLSELEKALSTSICPTCKRPFENHNSEELETDIASYKEVVRTGKEGLDEMDRQKKEYQNELNELKTKKTTTENMLRDYQALELYSAQIKSSVVDVTQLQTELERTIEEGKQKLLEYDTSSRDTELASIRLEYEGIEKQLAEKQKSCNITAARYRLNEINAGIDQLNGSVRSILVFLGSIQERIETMESTEKKITIDEGILAQYTSDFNICSTLERHFSTTIKTLAVSSVIQRFEKKVNWFLKELTGGEFSITVQPDNVQTDIWNGGRKRTFAQCSGGEEKVIIIAVKLGLSELQFELSGGTTYFLLLDEIFDSLDGFNVDGVYRLVKEMSKKFDRILLVTHMPTLQAKFDNVLTVRKDIEGISTIHSV
jgi:DNA repair exonuclease SbcCD ATPase subunit